MTIQEYIHQQIGPIHQDTIIKDAEEQFHIHRNLFIESIIKSYPSQDFDTSYQMYRNNVLRGDAVIEYIESVLHNLQTFNSQKLGIRLKRPVKITSNTRMKAEYMTGCSHSECELLVHTGLDLFTRENIINSLVHEYCHVLQGQLHEDCSNPTVEGTAYLYEQIVFENGFLNKDYAIGYYQDQLLRISRFLLCILYHSGIYTQDEVLNMFQAMTYLPLKISKNEMERICQDYESLDYYLGKWALQKYKVPILYAIQHPCLSIRQLIQK